VTGDVVTLDVVYPFSPERVWRALTDPNALARWLLPNIFASRLGYQFVFTAPRRGAWDGVIACEVVQFDPPHCLAFSWQGDHDLSPTIVRFVLEPVAAGTHLRLEHAASAGLSVGYALDEPWDGRLRRLFRLQVDEVALTDELFAYLRDPAARGVDRPLVRWLRSVAPEVVPVLESMLLDGVEDRPDVAHFVHALDDGDLARHLRVGRLRRATHAADEWPSVLDLPRLFRLQVDHAALVDEVLAFVIAPVTSRSDHTIVGELDELAPDVLPALETLIVEGITDRAIVADYLRGALGPSLE
jgi:uncharacterized protein YndB with AHSA1/START domain